MDWHDLRNSLNARTEYIRSEANKIEKFPIGKTEHKLNVAAVDGGLFYKRMYGFDLLALRAIGVVFGKTIEYVPSKRPDLTFFWQDSIGDPDQTPFISLNRLNEELKIAEKILETKDIDLLLMDGSIFPLAVDIPSKNSVLWPLYEEVSSRFNALHRSGKICGVIKDSRSCFFDNSISDVVLCNYALEGGERTEIYDFKPNLPLIESSGKFFYFKYSKYASVLRVEFIDFEDVDKILLSLNPFKKQGYPLPLLDAHLCAKIDMGERSRLEKLLTKVGISTLTRDYTFFKL